MSMIWVPKPVVAEKGEGKKLEDPEIRPGLVEDTGTAPKVTWLFWNRLALERVAVCIFDLIAATRGYTLGGHWGQRVVVSLF